MSDEMVGFVDNLFFLFFGSIVFDLAAIAIATVTVALVALPRNIDMIFSINGMKIKHELKNNSSVLCVNQLYPYRDPEVVVTVVPPLALCVIVEVDIIVPSLKQGDSLTSSVTLPSLFCFQLNIMGIPSGGLLLPCCFGVVFLLPSSVSLLLSIVRPRFVVCFPSVIVVAELVQSRLPSSIVGLFLVAAMFAGGTS